jgi:hypothetical protein
LLSFLLPFQQRPIPDAVAHVYFEVSEIGFEGKTGDTQEGKEGKEGKEEGKQQNEITPFQKGQKETLIEYTINGEDAIHRSTDNLRFNETWIETHLENRRVAKDWFNLHCDFTGK